MGDIQAVRTNRRCVFHPNWLKSRSPRLVLHDLDKILNLIPVSDEHRAEVYFECVRQWTGCTLCRAESIMSIGSRFPLMKLRQEHRKWSIPRRERKTVAIEWKRNASDLFLSRRDSSSSDENGKRDFSHFFGKHSINERVIQLTGLVRNRTLSSSLLSEELLNTFALSSITLNEKISFFFVFLRLVPIKVMTEYFETTLGDLGFVRFLPTWITTMTRCVRRAASIDRRRCFC